MTETRKKAAATKQKPEAGKYPPPHELLPERAHLENCPMDPDRMEIYESRKPPKVQDGVTVEPARMVPVAHCLSCGETRVVEDQVAEAAASSA